MIRIPKDAVIKANARLRDHNVLRRTDDGDGRNTGGESLKADMVEFMKPPATDRLANCAEMRINTCSVLSSGGLSAEYDWLTKDVNTAENKPAYVLCKMEKHKRTQKYAHKNEKGIDIFVYILYPSLIVRAIEVEQSSPTCSFRLDFDASHFLL